MSTHLDALLDDHAELRDVAAALREAADPDILSGLLQRLHGLLREHFAREEAVPSMQRVLSLPSGSSAESGTRLIDEHRALLSTLGALVAKAEANGQRSAAAIAPDVVAFMKRLQAHDARETELLGENVDAVQDTPSPDLRSRALETNLRRTAVDVVIPPEQAVLLEIVSDRHGVHESTRKLLREINHRYVGWPQTLEELHRRAMSDFAYYVGHERAGEAIGVFCSLYAKAADQTSDSSLRETAIRRWLQYLEKAVDASGERLPRLAPSLEHALSHLAVIFRGDPHLAVVASARLRRFAEKLLAAAPDPGGKLAELTLELAASALRQVYLQWLALPDPAVWWREQADAEAEAALPERVAAISHPRLRESLERLDHLTSRRAPLAARAGEFFALPDAARIERGYLDAMTVGESQASLPGQSPIERIRWLVRLLSIEALAAVHPQALAEIHHACRDALAGADRVSFETLLRETFEALHSSHLASSPAGLALISKIGIEAVATGDPERANVVIEELLDWDFPGPAFSGFTDEWQVQVDPAHLRTIRAFLAVIKENPELAQRLIAALVVYLKIGGVFMADTDLFQRDVSELLNSGIGPVYHQVKHLLKLFPVYFNEIGAEGELREVSSRIDEIGARKDPLCHFLRKQCHVESNPRLIGFIDAIGEFWARRDPSPLQPYLSPALYERLDVASEECHDLHRAFSKLLDSEGVAGLATLDSEALEQRLAQVYGARDVDREKVRLLVRLRKLVSRKYELDHDGLLDRLAALRSVHEGEIHALRRALAEQRDEEALSVLLGVLERLKSTMTRKERTEGIEDIYRKRHIAAGIPSVYGRYREEKFEAMGLSLRIESLARALFERMISEANFHYVTHDTLRRTLRWLRLLLRAVRVDGCHGRGLATGSAMLDQALSSEGISVAQYINVFQIISRGIEQLIRIRFIEVYREDLDRILRRTRARRSPTQDEGGDEREEALMLSEGFLRDLIAESLGLQPLDRLLGRALRSLVRARESFDHDTLNLLLSFDADRCCVPIESSVGPLDGAVLLGSKGYLIKRLAHHGLPVPDGFILTTEVFRCEPAIRVCGELRAALRERIRGEIARLERLTGSRFGDPQRPLLLSVRSGAAVSMPGVLDTFLNVGISEEIAEGLAAHSGSRWGAWDAYRRFLQFWGMGHDIARDRFDALMREFKSELGVAKKAEIPSEAMKDMALRYRRFVEDHGVKIPEDPVEQVERCVDLVLRSWDAEKARVYRGELQIAEEWGTAVIVQRMVYGNLGERSGTGVVLTCDPRCPSRDVRLYGDFVVQGQGDDVVSGLVETFPISEKQRLSESTDRGRSLERDFPHIYRALLAHGRSLVLDHGMFHQEIEFTFESDDPADLFILQVRDTVMAEVSSVSVFEADDALERARLATGIGAGGGALSGRLAHTAEDIENLRRRFPDDAIILIRPDTVPDDIPLILRVDGMLTALGGATSHAALVAQQLGRTCVVGCRELQVDEEQGCSQLGGHTLSSGDLISISGIDGSVYLGRRRSTTVRRRRLL